MQLSTLERLQCPIPDCGESLKLAQGDRHFGMLACTGCSAEYPILAGVAIVVPDAEGYIIVHVKGISKWVRDDQIPKSIRKAYLAAKKAVEKEHIEEDLESDRVNALYFMTHYLNTKDAQVGVESPEIKEIIVKNWDRGPFSVVQKWIEETGSKKAVELGCGVGGLADRLAGTVQEYLGVDSSFASIALARAIYINDRGINEEATMAEQGIPADLLQGPLSRKINLKQLRERIRAPKNIDFIVGDLETPPLKKGHYDASIVLNAIDMMGDPAVLPRVQKSLIRPGGIVIQSAPYIWHEQVAAQLRKKLTPSKSKDVTSAQAIEYIYSKNGLKIEKSLPHVPWVFFKHLRQIEIYSVHAFLSRI